jgi:hypothetical protein
MENQNLTSEEQMSIIENSLKHTSKQKTGASNYYIIWGAVLTTTFMVHFLNTHFKTDSTAILADISISLYAVGGLLSFLQSRKDDKSETVVPLNEKVYKYAWIGASIGIGVMSISQGYSNNFIELFCIIILLIFGLINFIIGGVTNFKPLIIGGVLSMLLIILIPLSTIDYKFLITAIGVLFNCLIPGLMMKHTQANV